MLAFDPGDGWTDFVPEVTEHDRIWEGRAENEAGTVPLGDFAGWLAARRGRGVVFLVERKSKQVVWSTYARPRDARPETIDKTAQTITARLKKDLGGK